MHRVCRVTMLVLTMAVKSSARATVVQEGGLRRSPRFTPWVPARRRQRHRATECTATRPVHPGRPDGDRPRTRVRARRVARWWLVGVVLPALEEGTDPSVQSSAPCPAQRLIVPDEVRGAPQDRSAPDRQAPGFSWTAGSGGLQPLPEGRQLLGECGREPLAEARVVLLELGHLGEDGRAVHAEKLFRPPARISRPAAFRSPGDGSEPMASRASTSPSQRRKIALDDSAVLPEARPHEVAVLAAAEPVDVETGGAVCPARCVSATLSQCDQ